MRSRHTVNVMLPANERENPVSEEPAGKHQEKSHMRCHTMGHCRSHFRHRHPVDILESRCWSHHWIGNYRLIHWSNPLWNASYSAAMRLAIYIFKRDLPSIVINLLNNCVEDSKEWYHAPDLHPNSEDFRKLKSFIFVRVTLVHRQGKKKIRGLVPNAGNFEFDNGLKDVREAKQVNLKRVQHALASHDDLFRLFFDR